MVPSPVTSVLTRRECRDSKTQREGHGTAEAEAGVMLPLAKRCSGLAATARSG